ncbi:hypothetical protein LWI29_005874 [Acer saccharum]|uniref:Uncharacterized protein n=1 Tax=Acer saccharum TaxID=4024 RepID=A0AA39SRQ1_ACESA|nr:hypothetical protein LWI29_005874 [Acer saccharum]
MSDLVGLENVVNLVPNKKIIGSSFEQTPKSTTDRVKKIFVQKLKVMPIPSICFNAKLDLERKKDYLAGESDSDVSLMRGGEIFVPKNIGIGKELDKSNKLPCELVVSNGAASKSHSVIEDQMGPLMDFNNSVDNQLGQEGQVGLSPSGRIVAGYESSLKEI